jgi:hypothetical protein
MTTPVTSYGPDPRSRWVFRLSTMTWAALLGVQCIWLLLPELFRSNVDQLPTDTTAASEIAKHSDTAFWAASLGGIRGDLWAESAFTRANLLWPNDAKGAENLVAASQRARASLEHALHSAPHIAGAWLMLACLVSRFNTPDGDPIELLKLSYYTGPSNRELVPLRLGTAIRLESFNDFEMRELISRDIRLLLAQKRDAVIAKIYHTASLNSKNFLDQAIRDIDPSVMDMIRNGGPTQ